MCSILSGVSVSLSLSKFWSFSHFIPKNTSTHKQNKKNNRVSDLQFTINMVFTLKSLIDLCVVKRGRMKHKNIDKREAYEELWRALNEWMTVTFQKRKVCNPFLSLPLSLSLLCNKTLKIICSGSTYSTTCRMELGVLSSIRRRNRRGKIRNQM